ncbi:alpha-glucuronidase [Ferruginibacter sp. HRS2-29]|uniref:alpha-glucuronidase n=1 Tax=Ferruginibacter sp. HRS2-29 TaxID=2487334 RepID=UPI0020CCF85F|nr:alpha-glucuronidase [Ferruginibacter sp. HRS2-29]MCP9753483.1 alpha-glucuronidase [Ferruginibacter sp. HRS2-29]
MKNKRINILKAINFSSVKKLFLLCILFYLPAASHADNGHDLWLKNVKALPVNIIAGKKTAAINLAIQELNRGWTGRSGASFTLTLKKDKALKTGGFILSENGVQAGDEWGVLYGVYEILRRQQTGQPVQNGEVVNPSYQQRILNHWDNLDGSIERGYSGLSIFWKGDKNTTVTDADKKLWMEYARANASIGINGSVLNNVNASPQILNAENLQRLKAIADVLRTYGIRSYLSINFSSPARLGGLKNSDPLDPAVIQWWKDKVKEIYTVVPDFGGFLVKANSEGQPGPQDFGRTHANGANMLADIVKPYKGIIMWRAFVYSPTDKDRAKQAYNEFMPLDGKFRDNVIIQVKNGPVDFQPREPFSALFGAMKKTTVMPEVQITQEYLGHSEHLVFLSTLWEEFLKSDTYQEGKGSTVGRCTDGSIFNQANTAIAGVANVGLDTNWCGHPFAQSNWYAFGRLAWNNTLTSGQIANEWIQLSFSNSISNKDNPLAVSEWERNFLLPVKQIMMESREAAVNYSMPLGLHHIFAGNHHFGPGPWDAPKRVRADWTPPYYHQAAADGIGFNRTKTGTDAVEQYHEPLASTFNDINTCPEIYLLWFHHVSWDHKMKSGKTFWDELCYHYNDGVMQVRQFQKTWDAAEGYVDQDMFTEVQRRLKRQEKDAQVWKDGCLLYFQTFSKMPIPAELERPVYDLKFLQASDMLRVNDNQPLLPVRNKMR